MAKWPFTINGTPILAPTHQRIIDELRRRYAAGQPMQRLVDWLHLSYGIEITAAGIWRLLEATRVRPKTPSVYRKRDMMNTTPHRRRADA